MDNQPELTEEEMNQSIFDEEKDKKQKQRKKVNELSKQYYHNNKEKIRERLRQWCICEKCGSRLKKENKSRHQKTQRCREIAAFVASQPTNQ